MGKLKKYWYAIFDVLDDVLAYALTIIGIIMSNYIPMLKQNGKIDFIVDWPRLAIAAVVAILIVGKQEGLDIDKEDGTTAKAREGRRRRFGFRMVNALSQGMMWSQLINFSNI
jgi:hypothetical protein